MKREEIWNEWTQDYEIDKHNLDSEALNIGKLYSKYLRYLSNEKLTLNAVKEELKTISLPLFEYWTGSAEKPSKQMVMKQDVQRYIDNDPEVQKYSLRIGILQDKISTLEAILELIKNRSYHINAAIQWKKFMKGEDY